MDVFIFGAKGAGKSVAARKIVADYLTAHDAPKQSTLLVSPEVFSTSHLATYLQRTEARVLIFDGVIRTQLELQRAIGAVDTCRSRVDYKIMSLYCIQGETKNYITYAHDRQP